MKQIGVLTSGGDAPGMNAAIYGLATKAHEAGVEVRGYIDGFEGLIDNDYITITPTIAKPYLGRGGTFLGTARSERFMDPQIREKVAERLVSEKIDSIVIIGGDGSYQGALKLHEVGIKTLGIPATIDNDIRGTDLTLGFKTAVRNVVETVDIILQSASSHRHIYGIEVMGRGAGYIAEWSGRALGADGVISDKSDFDTEKIRQTIDKSIEDGNRYQLFIIAERAMTAKKFGEIVEKETGYAIHDLVLGHIQRGGNPVAEDRILGRNYGEKAFKILGEGQSGVCLAVNDEKIVSQKLSTHL